MADVAIAHGEPHGADHPETTTGLPAHEARDVDLPRLRVHVVRRADHHVRAVPGTPSTAPPFPADIFDIPYTSVSSFVLLTSSLTMVLALSAAQDRDFGGCVCGCSPRRCSG